MKNSIIITFAALVVACGAAVAAPGNNGGGAGGCGVGQQTNGCGGTPATPGAVNNGGSGGAGGAGGIGIGGSATGGSVLGSGNSSSSSGVVGSGNSANINTLGQQQGQAQGQAQGQQQGQVATGGSSSSTSGASSNSGGNTFTTGATTQTVTSGPVSQSNAGNNTQTSVTVHGDTYEAQKRNPVSTAYSGPLAASNGTCLGSASGGLQTVAVGVSFGTTTLDEGCDARFDAIALSQLGEHAAARARLCLKPEIAKAMEDAGVPCAGTKKVVAAGAYAQIASASNNSRETEVQYRDPIIRKRLGLPPLN